MILYVEEIEVIQDDPSFSAVAPMHQHKRTKHSGHMLHALLWRNTRPFQLVPHHAIRLKLPNIVETGHHVQVLQKDAPTPKQDQLILVIAHRVRHPVIGNDAHLGCVDLSPTVAAEVQDFQVVVGVAGEATEDVELVTDEVHCGALP